MWKALVPLDDLNQLCQDPGSGQVCVIHEHAYEFSQYWRIEGSELLRLEKCLALQLLGS